MKNPFRKSKSQEMVSAETQPQGQSRFLVMSSGDLVKPNEYRSHIEKRVQSIISSGTRANDSILAAVVAGSVPAMVCINFHSTVVSSIPIVANDDLGKPSPFVPMKNMLDNRMRWLIRDLDKSLLIWGYAMARKHYNSERRPTLLEFLNPLNVRINVDAKQNIIDYRLNREQIDLQLNEVVYISGFDSQNTGNSVSKLETALPYTSLERGIVTHAASFFFNGATITGVVTIEKTLSDDDFKIFEKQFARRYKGANNAFNVAIFDRQVTYTPISAAPADLAMPELSDQSKQFVCANFGVNPSLVGLGDVSDPLSALSTYKETRRSFVDMEATPALDFILDNFNTQWALTDFSVPIHLVSDSSAMAMMNDGISTDDAGVATSLVDGSLWTVDEGREHVGYKPSELDDGWPRRNPNWANSLWADGTITLNQKRKMLGIEPPLGNDMIKVDGITYLVSSWPQVAEKNLEKLAAPAPSPFGLSITAPPPPATPMLNDGMVRSPLADLVDIRTSDEIPDDSMLMVGRHKDGTANYDDFVMVKGIARQITPRLIIGIDLADRQLLKLANRELGRALAETNGITWVAPENWRVELAHIDRWSPADIANMTRVIKWDFNKIEVWTGNYFVNGNGVYLSLGDTEDTQRMVELVHSDLRSVAIKSNEVVPAMAVRLAHGDGITQEMLPKETALGSMPIVFTRIAAFANDRIQHKWRLRAYYDKDNQTLLGKQRDELSKWQQRVARSGVGAAWAIDCLPQHVVRFVKDDALEELRLAIAKFIEEEHNRDPEGKFAPSGGGGGKDEDKKKDEPKQLGTKQDVLDVINNTANFDADGKLDLELQAEVDDYISLAPNSSDSLAIQDALTTASEKVASDLSKQDPLKGQTASSGQAFLPRAEKRTQSEPPPGSFDVAAEADWINNSDTSGVNSWTANRYDEFQDFSSDPIALENASDADQIDFGIFEKSYNEAPQYDGVVWRGASSRQDFDTTFADYKSRIGENLMFPEYNSSSASYQRAESFGRKSANNHNSPIVMFEMYGDQGRYINEASDFKEEREILLPPDASYTVRDVYIRGKQEGGVGNMIFVVMDDA